MIDLQSRQIINPPPTRFVSGKANEWRWRPRRYQVDPWYRGKRLPAASYALLPKLTKGPTFAIGEGSRNFLVCFLYTSGQMVWYQTPGPRPPHITGRVVNTVTRGWGGVPNERVPFRFLNSMSVEDSESRRFGLNIWLSFSQADRSWLNIWPGMFFFVFSESLELFC